MNFLSKTSTEKPIRENRLFLGFISPDTLREIVGILGMLLPFLLVIGNGMTIEPSISAYYHTGMRPIFMGYFLLLGYLLIAYRGFPESRDDEVSLMAGFISIGIALIRVTPPGSATRDLLGWFHVILTIIFFIILTFMSWHLFTLGPDTQTWQKTLHRLSAIVMFICMVAIMGFNILDLADFPNSTFWFEVIAFEFFGLSWFVKGL